MRSANGPCRRTEDAENAAPPAPASSRPGPVTGDRIAHRYGCRPEPGAAGLFGARLSHALSLSLFPSTHLGAGAVLWLQPGVRELSAQLRFPPEVARREVKRHGRLDPGGPGNGARRARREMRLALGVCPVGIQKDGLDEQQIGALKERGQSSPVALAISHIRHIADLLARHEFQYPSLQFA